MAETKIMMGSLDKLFSNTLAQDITFCVTEECNLRCKYCYMVHKNSFRRLDLETAKRAVDFVLSQHFEAESVVWDFIGGEPTLEMDLIDQLSDYIKLRMYELNHPWFSDYMFSIGSNGILYSSEKVQKYIRKNKQHLSFGITIDGTQKKHDLQRVLPDGSGSYSTVIKNIPLWLEQFPNSSTKVTFASADLKYLKESIIHLWKLGLKLIPANIVYEDVWDEGDPEVFKQQLIELADYIIENHLWEDYSVRFFEPSCGLPLSKKNKQHNFCGSGKMIAVDCDGKLYPCIRFLNFCMPDSSTPTLLLGDIDSGFNEDIRGMFKKLSVDIVNDNECEQCPIADGCFACAGNNYACSTPHSIFTRTKYHCEMQYAQAAANDYFWDQLAEVIDEPSPREQRRKKTFLGSSFSGDGYRYLYIILNENSTSFCMYHGRKESSANMSDDTFKQCWVYARENFMLPVFLGNPEKYMSPGNWNQYFVIIDSITNVLKMERFQFQTVIPVVNAETYTQVNSQYITGIVLIDKHSVSKVFEIVQYIAPYFTKLNLRIPDLDTWEKADMEEYNKGLKRIMSWWGQRNYSDLLINTVPTDEMCEEKQYCSAGTSTWAVSPAGNLFYCPAFYYQGSSKIGDVWNGMEEYDKNLFGPRKNTACRECPRIACKSCYALNERCSHAVNIPAEKQCMLSAIIG